MQDIIKPIDRTLLKQELNKKKLVKHTNNGGNDVYIITHHDSPNVMKELGRLREVTFRAAGGGTGKECDIDKYDTAEIPYKQLLVWDPKDEEIIGGYRFICCKDAAKNKNGTLMLATRGLLEFSKNFEKNYLPFTIELGRSFVQPKYQPTNNIRKGLFALDNIWDGLGYIIIDNPTMKYLFGKVTMYKQYNATARDVLIYFLQTMFPDKENLIFPTDPVPIKTDINFLKNIFTANTFEENFKILVKTVRKYGENIPPLINIYMNLSPTMKTFGTSINKNFGNVEETGIMVTIADIYDSKKERHLTTLKKNKNANN